jgi:hypothetical protein
MNEILSEQGNPIGSFWHRAEFDGTESADDAAMKALGWHGAVWSYTWNARVYMHGLTNACRSHLSFDIYNHGILRVRSIEIFDLIARAIAKAGGHNVASYLEEFGAVRNSMPCEWEIPS